jgi:hypothetical protein
MLLSLVVLNSQHPRTNKPFRFENWWLMKHEYQNIMTWQDKVGNDPPLVISHKRPSFLLHILGDGEGRNPRTKFLISKACTHLSNVSLISSSVGSTAHWALNLAP